MLTSKYFQILILFAFLFLDANMSATGYRMLHTSWYDLFVSILPPAQLLLYLAKCNICRLMREESPVKVIR